jgi:hypothetical protein
MMILAATVLFECGPKQYSEFTVEHPVKLSGQLLDPQGAAVPNLKLVLRCGADTMQVRTDLEGNYDFGVLQAGVCKIGTPGNVWKPPEVKCDERGCVLENLRIGLTSMV